ncbi:MAG: sporulation protein YqfD [Ruminococcaceae bacterium]|nr:sporulation protein YqfD [Oscillospiraceae bacterium]
MGKAFGYVKFMLLGADCEAFFTDAINNGIKIFDVENVKGVYYAKTLPKDYIRLARLKGKRQIQMRIAERHGIAFRLYRYRYRYGILLGAAVFCAVLYFCSGIVWDITVTGNERIPEESILEFLADNGIYPGVPRKAVQNTVTELKAMMNYKDLAWISIEENGSRINVKVSESVENPYHGLSVSTPCNLVAFRDGRIIYSEIHSGTMQYEIGSGVKEGDVVVSGIVTDEAGNVTIHHADAKIIAEFEEEVSFYKEFTTTEQVKTKESYTQEYIKLFGFSFPNKGGQYIDGYTYTSDSYAVKLFGLTMPWTKIKVTGVKTENVEVTRSVNDVKRSLQQELDKYEVNFLKNYEITDRNIKFERDEKGIKIICNYTLQGDILSQSEIFLRD